MLLFVLSTLVVFHFAIPEDAGDDAAYGLLWVAIVFTALLGLARAWVPEQEHGVLDGLVLAPCDRSAIWLGKTLATLAFLLAAQVVALPAFVLFFEPLDATALAGVLLADIGICAVGSLMSAMAAAGARARGAPSAARAAARDPARSSAAWVRRSRPTASASCSSSCCTTRSSLYSRGRPSSTSSRSSHLTLSSLRSLPGLAWIAAGAMGLALVLALIVAPEDADQGISQRIFYIHVPIALTAYFCFGLGAVKALLLLWRGDERYDLESYVAIHQGTIFGALTLITGAIWAKASWGVWWTWSSNQLVLFLVLFLFYCAYFMLRFSLEDGPRRARSSAVYALFGVALIPVSFLAIRLAEDFIHPTVFTRDGPQMSGTMFATFLRLVGRGDASRVRALSGRARRQAPRRRPARAARGAAVSWSQEELVAAAYAVVFVFVLVYVAIIAAKLVAAPARDGGARRARAAHALRQRPEQPDYAAPVSGVREGEVGAS